MFTQYKNNSYPVRLISYRVFFLLLILIGGNCAFAQSYYYKITPEIRKAYDLSEQLFIDEAKEYCEGLKQSQSGNLLVYHIENYADFYTCFISEEDAIYEKLKPNKEKRLSELEKGNKNSPYYRFSQAEVLLQWALVELKFKKYVSALLNINKARNLLEDNKTLFPDFQLTNKSLSLIHALIGTIPDSYKRPLVWISSFEGTISQGYEEISEMTCNISEDELFYKEIYVIKALIELHLLNDKTASWETVSNNLLDLESSPLIKFVTSNVAHRTFNNDLAISILENTKIQDNQLPFFYLDYLKGAYKLNNLDQDSKQGLLTYVNNFKGKNYIKEAYMKLAWYEYAVNNNQEGFNSYLDKCVRLGEAITDEDKYALKFAKSRILPNRIFLRSRLLFDGGYYSRAMEELLSIKGSLLIEEEDEFNYRKSRIHFEQKDFQKAINGFLPVISKEEKNEDFYLVSLYYTALSYENLQMIDLAKSYYKKVLQTENGAYKSSLDQKSKAGLLRLN